jgi:hypothetical protein
MSSWEKLRAAVLSIAGAAFFVLFGCEQQKYPWGRDTKDSFGNGRFQVGRVYTGHVGNLTPELVLYDCERRAEVARRVHNWTVRGDYVFLVDDNGKCWKVDYRTGAVTSFEKADAAEAPDRKVFEKLLE